MDHARLALGRRQAIGAAFAAGAAGALRCTPAGAQSVVAQATAPRMAAGTIDVHHHYFPPVFQADSDEFLRRTFGTVPPDIKNWSVAADLEAMDRTGIAMSVLNTSARPAQGVSPALYRTQARQANDFAARMVQDHPKRYAQFGFLPMPDVEGSLAEIAYCLDELKAPGIGLMTSYGSAYLGDPAFDPVLQELDRRRAVVFCHPRPGACCTALMPAAYREPLLIEFPYDTGRAAVGLLMSGSFARYRNIRWIFCHCGDVIPALSGRMRNVFQGLPAEERARIAPDGMDHEFQRQFYDTADGAYGPSMAAIRDYVPLSQVMFGTDYPYVSIETNARAIHERALPAPEMAAIQRGNVLALMPQLDG